MQILSVVPLDKRRSKILTDEDFAFVLYKGELKTYEIEEAKELPKEVYQEILQKILFKRAKERALYLLKSRDRTELEIRKKLKDGFYPKEAIEYAIVFLKEYRFVDDENYGRNYIRTYGNRKSRRQLEFELTTKGLAKEKVSQLLEECEVSESSQILRYLQKKGYQNGITSPKERSKLTAALMRKGFSYEAVFELMEGDLDTY